MFFTHWWQGIVFGFFTTIAMLVIAYAFTTMWKKYEDTPAETTHHGCDGHTHH